VGLGRIEGLPDHPLLPGYAKSTGSPIDFTEDLHVRLTLYACTAIWSCS
jgi:hypothetical protein